MGNKIKRYQTLFEKLYKELFGINKYIQNIIGTNNLTNCSQNVIYKSDSSTKAAALLIHFIFVHHEWQGIHS